MYTKLRGSLLDNRSKSACEDDTESQGDPKSLSKDIQFNVTFNTI